MQKNIVIVGAGLVGSLLACFLSKRGHKVTVYERRSDMRIAGYVGGRSINLALSHRGWKALKKIGLDKKVEPIAIPMKGRMIHDDKGNTTFIPYGISGQAIYSVSRGELNRLMVEEADRFENVAFHFDQRCTSINFETNELIFEDESSEGQKFTHEKADLIFGADGAYSQIRYEMQKTPNFNISQQHEQYGYKELVIPAEAGASGDKRWKIDKHCLHIWARKSFMMIALPNIDGSFTVTLFAPFEGENSFSTVTDVTEMRAYFTKHFPDALPLMPTLEQDYFANPVSSLVTVKCYPWKYKRTALIGDAAHAVVPFYGQGMNAGFEDVNELDAIIAAEADWDAALNSYQKQRKPNADSIADLALYNFIEMRDLSADPKFQLRLKIEKRIAERFGEKFMTHYSMVTFSDLSYAEAKRRGERQSKLLDEIMAMPGIENNWEGDTVINTAEKWIATNA